MVILTGCSSGDAEDAADDSSAPSDDRVTGEVGTLTEMEPRFDVSDLPDDFPSELIPESFTAGMSAQLGTIRDVNLESDSTFDAAVAEYTSKIGEEPIIVEGEERLAQWLVDVWAVTVIESRPTLISVTTAG